MVVECNLLLRFCLSFFHEAVRDLLPQRTSEPFLTTFLTWMTTSPSMFRNWCTADAKAVVLSLCSTGVLNRHPQMPDITGRLLVQSNGEVPLTKNKGAAPDLILLQARALSGGRHESRRSSHGDRNVLYFGTEVHSTQPACIKRIKGTRVMAQRGQLPSAWAGTRKA